MLCMGDEPYLSLHDALQVKWGEHSMVEALRALLRKALKDPLNQRFQLLCEYSLPLQSPLLVYQQFIKERKSRLNACNTFDWQEHVSAIHFALSMPPLAQLPQQHVNEVMRCQNLVGDSQTGDICLKPSPFKSTLSWHI